MRDVEGQKCGVIELAIDIESANDLSDKVEEMNAEQAEGIEFSIESMDLAFTFEGGGELLWNLRGGHVHSLGLQGDVTIGMDMSMTMNMGQEMNLEMSMDMSGTIEEKVETE